MSNQTDTSTVKPMPEIVVDKEAAGRRRRLIWGALALALVLLGLSLAWVFSCRDILWGGACHYYDIFTDKERIRQTLNAAGPLAPLFFIVVQVLQVVFAPIPGEATGFIGGFLFGVPLGMLYSTIGLTLGSILAFLLGRWLEEHFVARVVKPETLKRFDFLMERQGALVAFFLFVIPGFPKDYLCFILGLSLMPLRLFLVLSTVGRLPGTLMLTLQGAKVYQGDYLFSAILIGLCLLLGGILYYFRETLYTWLQRWDHGPEEKSDQ
ncbi:MAG: TVP38/TMEM64 family protein [Desulfobaccales bacterium]